jgi:hypothetical protein
VAEHRGEVSVEIPEVYELANVAVALTPYRYVTRQGPYYERLRQYFSPFTQHPLVARVSFSANDAGILNWYSFVENSFPFVFEGDAIRTGGIYKDDVNVWNGSNLFKENLSLVEDFARASRFRDFYHDNLPYYEEEIRRYREKVPVKQMWSWLEERSPKRYDSYKVVFSVLCGGTHMTQQCSDNGFTELVMFVSGPDFYEARGLPAAVEEGLLSRIVFTEIDHNYVNPITDQYPSEVKDALGPLAHWNAGAVGGSLYSNAAGTFNEYMTWAVFVLYASDTYDEPAFRQIVDETTALMVQSRGFPRFQEFSEKLLQLYKAQTGPKSIPSLYPAILSWAKTQR